jgi:uncharacterized damage-inducible protein DinB
MTEPAVRDPVGRLLSWEDAHRSFDAAVAGIPDGVRGRRPEGCPYSPWDLIEHIRVAQRDILDFCQDTAYREREWPADYWPRPGSPPSSAEWEASLTAYRGDRAALERLAAEQPDLTARVPHGDGQTYLRELLLVADHTAYHVGQLVLVRRLLGVWPGE